MSHYREEEEAPGYDIPDEREELLDEAGCLFPGRCAALGPHLRGECFVATLPLDAALRAVRAWERGEGSAGDALRSLDNLHEDGAGPGLRKEIENTRLLIGAGERCVRD